MSYGRIREPVFIILNMIIKKVVMECAPNSIEGAYGFPLHSMG